MASLLTWGIVAVALALSPVVEAHHLFHYLLSVALTTIAARHLAHG